MFKYFVLLFAILFSFESVNASSKDTTKYNMTAIEVRDSSFLFGEKSYRVFFEWPFVVYQSQYLSNSFVMRPKYDSVTHQESLVTNLEQSQWRSRFFVFHKDSSYGLTFDPYNSSETNQRLPVDSMLQMIRGTNNYEKVLAGKPDSTSWDVDRTVLKEVYVGKPEKDVLVGSLVFYYSSRLNHLKESLNQALDSAKKMKLYRVEILTEEFYSEKDKQLWPPMKNFIELKEITVEDSQEITRYITSYKRSTIGGK